MTEYLLDLESLAVSWELSMRSRGRAPRTIKSYLDGVRLYLRWCDQTAHPRELNKTTAQEYIAHVLSERTSATAQARHKALRQFSKWLTEEGETEADSLIGFKTPVGHVKVVDAFTDDELRRLFQACRGTTLRSRRDEALLRLMAECGLRAGEVLALRPVDVNLVRGLATVQKSKTRKGRVVPFGSQTATAIDRYMRAARKERRLTDEGPLWVGANGKTFGYNGIDKTLKDRAIQAGVANFHLHKLRNTAATRWLRAGGSEQGLMNVAGWSSRAMLDRYTMASASERAADEARGLNLGDL